MATIYTVGHSTRTFEALAQVLQGHGIQVLVDIRAFPMSRRLPYFNREQLEQALPKEGIQYVWEKRLGGRRKRSREVSPNRALRNDSFRNYADYMLTEDFRAGISEVLARAEHEHVAIMCAERVYFRCHRMLVSDWLTAHGHEVLHIDDTGPTKPHKLMSEARVAGGDVIYDEGQLL